MNNCIAVVIGTGSYNDLGMIRSCGESLMPVIYITNEKHIIPIHKSRYIIETYFIQFIESEVIDTLNHIIGIYQCPIFVYPTSDLAAYYLDCSYTLLQGRCYFSNAKGHMGELMDKYEMNQVAASCGITIPEMWKVNLMEATMPKEFPFPCIVKPLLSIGGDKEDITKCYNQKELLETFNKYKSKGHNRILVQRLINGKNLQELAITGVAFNDGNSLIYGEIQKKRIRGNGSTVFGIYHPNKWRNVYSKIQEFIKQSQYQGIFDIEFLENDEGLYFIECNFRNGAYGYAVTYAGFNMPYVYKQHCLNQSFELKSLKDVVFMEERSDFLNVLDRTITWKIWLKDVLSTDVFLFWNKRDIKPLLRIPHFIRKFFK